MEGKKKCSNKKHSDIDAIKYCFYCNMYLCNKCSAFHSEYLENHKLYNLDKNVEDIFTGICKESNHKEYLKFYCKSHNKLICAACLSKIKGNEYGQHFDCDVCLIEEIKNEIKFQLQDNIKFLEQFSDKIKNSINEFKNRNENINNKKEELKLKISKIFTKIRNIINEREDQLLLDIDIILKKFNKENLIKQVEKIPNKIKLYLEKGKKLSKEWDNDKNELNSKINDCIYINDNVKYIIEINKSLEKINSEKIDINFIPENERQINIFLEEIKKFGKIDEFNNFKFKFKKGNNYILTNNDLIATKNNGGNSFNCIVIGDKQIPKDKISKWKIKINSDMSGKYSNDLFIGIGTNNPKNNILENCWSFISSNSLINIKGKDSSYNNLKGNLKKDDIVEVIVDRKLGNLSFSINGANNGIACSDIPKEEDLYPTIIIFEQNQIVEILS